MSRHANRRRSLLPLLALTALVSCKGGCAGCGEEEPTPQPPETSPVPEDPIELTRGYAQHFPLGTHGMIVARGFEEVATSFADIKERIRPFFDLAQVESEIRNTFGVDIYRHVTFREVGVAYDGGFAVATVMQQPVVSFYLTNPEPFFARAAEVLRRQPFNLRAPLVNESVGDARIQLYARRASEPVEFAVVADRGFGFLIPRASTASEVEEVARALAETTPESSLAAHPDFDAQVARFADYPGFVFLDTVAASRFYSERLADQLSASSAHALEQVSNSLTSIAGGARLDGLVLSAEAYLAVTPEVVELADGIELTSDRDPGLSHFFLPTTFAAFRLGANPVALWRVILRFQGEGGAEVMQEALGEAESFLDTTLEDGLSEALTGQALIMVNRLAPLSLVRAESPSDYADAVDLLAVFEVGDHDRAVALLDGLVERSEGAYQRSEEANGTIRYNSGRTEASFGNIWVRDHLLVLGADRMTRVVNRLLEGASTEGTGEGIAELNPDARELMTAPVATGAFLTFDRLVPIATLLNYPQAVRDLLGFLQTLVVSLDESGPGLHVAGSLTFTPPTPPAERP